MAESLTATVKQFAFVQFSCDGNNAVLPKDAISDVGTKSVVYGEPRQVSVPATRKNGKEKNIRAMIWLFSGNDTLRNVNLS